MKKQIPSINFFLSTLFMCVICSCNSKPSTGTARSVFEDRGIDAKYARILDFKRVNGSMSENDGNAVYVVEVAVTVEFIQDGSYWDFGYVGETYDSNNFTKRDFKKGDIFTFQADLPFIKTENGWEFANN